MAVQLETTIQRFRGLSTDDKPATAPVGSIFTETDTGKRFVWTSSRSWTRQEQTIETFLASLIDVNTQMLQTLAEIKRGHEEYLWENEVPPE